MKKPVSTVLFVSSNFPPVIGGSSVVYDQLCRNAKGGIVALSAARDYHTGAKWASSRVNDQLRDYRIFRIPFLRPPLAKATGFVARFVRVLTVDIPILLNALITIVWLCFSLHIKTVCIGELVYNGWLVFPLRYVFLRRVWIYTHGEEITQDTSGLMARYRGIFLQHAHSIIAVSQFCKGQIVTRYKIDPGQIKVVSNGVDLVRFYPDSSRKDTLPANIQDKRLILSVSRLVDRKGQATLIHALPKILSSIPEAYCVIIGGGPLQQSLEALIKAHGLEQSCSILGEVEESVVTNYFMACDIFILPCRTMPDGDTEGFGLVFLEANACAKPVVAGAAGGTIEAVIDTETGYLVDGKDPVQVANAAIALLSNPSHSRTLGEQGRKRAESAGWDTVSHKFMALSDRPRARQTGYSFEPRHFAFAAEQAVPPRLLVTVDVEEQFEWDRFSRNQYHVRGSDALARFHEDCKACAIKPVYLLTHPILKDKAYLDFLRNVHSKAEAELGIHPHAWTAPPFWEEPNAFTSYQCNLPRHVEKQKLKQLTALFEDSIGEKVSIHRAGRWGGNSRTSDLLEDLGISVDLSPSTGYRDRSNGGPDFSNLTGRPFWSGRGETVLTVPASSLNYSKGPTWLSTINFKARRKWPKSSLLPVGKPVRFSPENADFSTLLAMSKEIRLRAIPTAVYTLHSTSLYTGGNQYSRDEPNKEALLINSFQFLKHVVTEGLVTPTTCSALYAEAIAQREKVQVRQRVPG